MKNRRLILSTGNPNKVEEIKDILKDLPIDVLSKDEVGFKNFEIEEDGDTLEKNSLKKAKSLQPKVEGIILADDTGLFVDYLNGQPGVNSSRYSGEVVNADEKNREKLLRELKGVPMENRTATFKTVMALVFEDGKHVMVTGECKGSIGFELKGSNGFGYDPLFIVDGYNKTFAELGADIKNSISHRAKALEKMKIVLINILEDDTNENNNSK